MSSISCGECLDSILDAKDNNVAPGSTPLCVACLKQYHYKCTSVSESSWTIMGAPRRDVWVCPNCRSTGSRKNSLSKDSSTGGVTQELLSELERSAHDSKKRKVDARRGDGSLEYANQLLLGDAPIDNDTIKPLLRGIYEILMDLRADRTGADTRVSALEEKYEIMEEKVDNLENIVHEQNQKIEKLIKENAEMRKDLSSVRSDQIVLRGDVDESRYEHRLLDSYGRLEKLIIQGARNVKTQQEAKETVIQIAGRAGVTLGLNEISTCHVLPSRSGPPRIICRFPIHDRKEQVKAAIRKARLTAAAFGWGPADCPVIASDHLTPRTAKLLAYTKKRLAIANGLFKFIRVKMGRILIRANESQPIVEIKCIQDVDRIAASAATSVTTQSNADMSSAAN